jgi:hypothetical protein
MFEWISNGPRILIVLLIVLVGWGAIQALRTRHVQLGGHQFSRAKYPLQYWASVSAGVLFVVLGIIALLLSPKP